ncbi:lytic transglycosylase domain-containing protein [Acidobacteria bacterium AH-259-A15]|nr:lytic transglycosylase domain-containing protein [Acidobacteria bacterium AH-259-A15]
MYFALLLIVCLSTCAFADPLYSYVNEDGVKIFTNIGVGRSDKVLSRPASPLQDVRERYISLISKAAAKYRLDENLVKAITWVESRYNPKAISPKGCIGLMQLHPDTARRFDVRDIFDPAENIEGGTKYLNFLMNAFRGNLRHVLAAYNAGEKAVMRYNGVPPYPETQQYVRKVMALYQSLGPSPPRAGADNRRLYRVVLPNGSILFTDARSRHLLSKNQSKTGLAFSDKTSQPEPKTGHRQRIDTQVSYTER